MVIQLVHIFDDEVVPVKVILAEYISTAFVEESLDMDAVPSPAVQDAVHPVGKSPHPVPPSPPFHVLYSPRHIKFVIVLEPYRPEQEPLLLIVFRFAPNVLKNGSVPLVALATCSAGGVATVVFTGIPAVDNTPSQVSLIARACPGVSTTPSQ